MSYEFTRTYRSGVDYRGPLGYGWDHNYNRRLIPECDGTVTYHDGSLRIISFTPNPSPPLVASTTPITFYSPQAGISLVLEKHSDGFVVREPSGVSARFNHNTGLLSSLEDLAGNKMQFTWDKRNRLKAVTDTTGRNIYYFYSDDVSDFLQCVSFTGCGNPIGTPLITFNIEPDWHNEQYGELKSVANAVGKGPRYGYYHPLRSQTPYVGDVFLDDSCNAFCNGGGVCGGESICDQTKDYCAQWHAKPPTEQSCLQSRAEWYPYCASSQNQTDCYNQCVTTYQTPDPYTGLHRYAYGRITDLNHNLTTIFDAEGNRRLANYYGEDLFAPSFDRVITQMWGQGQVSFEYHDLVKEAPLSTPVVHPQPVTSSNPLGNIHPKPIAPATNVLASIHPIPPLKPIPTVTPANKFYAIDVCPKQCDQTGAGGQCALWTYGPATSRKKAPAYAIILNDVRGVDHTSYYDEDWLLVREVNVSNGEVTDYSYDSGSNLVGIANPAGDRLCVERDGSGRVTQFTHLPAPNTAGSAAAQVTVYTYDAKGQLVDVVEDPKGRAARVSIERDAQERAHIMRRSIGGGQTLSTTINYGIGLNVASVVGPGGEVTQYGAYDVSGGGPVSVTIDALSSAPLSYYAKYNNLGLATERGEQGGAGERRAYNAAGQLYQLDRFVDPAATVDTTTFVLNGNGSPKQVDTSRQLHQEIEYSLLGDVTQITEGLKTGGIYATRSRCYSFHPDGVARAEIAPAGDGTAYAYDEADRLVSIVRGYGAAVLDSCSVIPPTSLGSPEEMAHFDYLNGGFLKAITVDGVRTDVQTDGFGRTIELSDGTGRIRRRGYDFRNRMIWEAVYTATAGLKPYGYPAMGEPGLAAMTEFHFDDLDRVVEQDRWRVETKEIEQTFTSFDDVRRTSTTTRAGAALIQIFDGAGRLVSVQYPNGAISTTSFAGHVATQKTPTPGGVVTEVITYDGLWLPSRIEDGNGGLLFTAQHDIDGATLSQWEKGQLGYTREFDGYGRLTAEKRQADPSTWLTTQLAWDDDDRLKAVTDAESSTTSFEYDGLDRVTSKTDPVGAKTIFRYVPGTQRLMGRHDPSSADWTFDYDPAGRVVSETLKSVPWLPDYMSRRTFNYDALDNLTVVQQLDGAGKVVSSVALGYDSLGNQVSDSSLHSNLAIQHTYSIDGLQKTTTVGTSQLQHSYDQLGRLASVTLNGASLATYTYAPATLGGPQKVEYSNGSRSLFGYDTRGRQVGTVVESVLNGTTISNAFVKDTPDAAETSWTRQRWTRGAAVETNVFNFDGAGRLSQESQQLGSAASTVRTYALDGVADWKTRAVTGSAASAMTYNAAHQLTAMGASYDPDGNLRALTEAQPEQFEYDYYNRLTSATIGTTSVSYTYDALGRRVSESSAADASQLVWDGNDIIATGLGQSLSLQVNGQDINDHIASISALGAGSKLTYHQAADQSTLAVTGDAGFIEGYSYSAFGETTILGPTGTTRASSVVANRFLFQGQLHDPLTQTYSMRAREYHPRTGRFLSADPTGLAGGLNLYGFADGNPVLFTDPLGLSARLPHVPYPTEVVGRDQPWPQASSIPREFNGAPPPRARTASSMVMDMFAGPAAQDAYDRSQVDSLDIPRNDENPWGPLERLSQRSAQRTERAMRHVDFWGKRLGDVTGGIISAVGAPVQLGALRATYGAALKAVNLPAWRKVAVDMEHIASGHMPGGGRVSAAKTVFPASMNETQVEAAIREAYRYSEKVAAQGERVLLRGQSFGLTIEMWLNRATKTIETAYPVF